MRTIKSRSLISYNRITYNMTNKSFKHDVVKPRARDWGIPFAGLPGPGNAITDVAGVAVGHRTLIAGEGALIVGQGPVRTGVTAIFPYPQSLNYRVPAAWFALNGNGEMTGTTWIRESGFLECPILLTNTHSVGIARDALVAWGARHFLGSENFGLPVVAETFDGWLNDINGFHVRQEHVWAALDAATGGAVAEGNVGGGTGMILYEFKGGIGTASRQVTINGVTYTLGVLIQGNYGRRDQLIIAGVPVGQKLTELMPVAPDSYKMDNVRSRDKDKKDGSIIIIIATDAPLLSQQLHRLTKRAAMGLARAGSVAMNSSGDILLAFSTVPPQIDSQGLEHWRTLPNDQLDKLFTATIQATEEAIINALVAAETLTGINGRIVYQLPQAPLTAILKQYGRWEAQ
jgi:D-aminopeptidase